MVPTNGQPRWAGAATVIDRKTLACKQFRLLAAGPGGVPTAMPETRLVADEDFAWAERVHSGSGWVIHFPAVVCNSSPNTTLIFALIGTSATMPGG
jgi:hypothetical protein